METVTVKTPGKSYEILIESGLFSNVPELIKERYKGRKLALISDSDVFPLYGKELAGKLEQSGFKISSIVFEAGEERKNLHTLNDIYGKLADGLFTRSDVIIALGGGVTGDIAGLAAATFLRGMGLVQVPTTLLSMVDSSIGGKTAVDLPQGKNLVGAFYQPDVVFTDPLLLKTLTDRQFSDGMAELLKHAFIRDYTLYKSLVPESPDPDTDHAGDGSGEDRPEREWPEGDRGDRSGGNPRKSSPRKALAGRLDGIIKQSCIIKRDIVEQDERDNGVRQLLNFGHTVGHAIERLSNYREISHGEAISMGMAVITCLTEKMGLTDKRVFEKLVGALNYYGLPTSVPAPGCEKPAPGKQATDRTGDPGHKKPDVEQTRSKLVDAVKIDKKNRSGRITIAYIEKIGLGKLFDLTLTELEAELDDVLKSLSGTA